MNSAKVVYLGLFICSTACSTENLTSKSAATTSAIDVSSLMNSITANMKSDPQFFSKVTAAETLNFSAYGHYFSTPVSATSADAGQALDKAYGSMGNFLAANHTSMSTITAEELNLASAMGNAFKSGASLSGYTLADAATALKSAVFLVHSAQNGLSLFSCQTIQECNEQATAAEAAKAARDAALLTVVQDKCTADKDTGKLTCDIPKVPFGYISGYPYLGRSTYPYGS